MNARVHIYIDLARRALCEKKKRAQKNAHAFDFNFPIDFVFIIWYK